MHGRLNKKKCYNKAAGSFRLHLQLSLFSPIQLRRVNSLKHVVRNLPFIKFALARADKPQHLQLVLSKINIVHMCLLNVYLICNQEQILTLSHSYFKTHKFVSRILTDRDSQFSFFIFGKKLCNLGALNMCLVKWFSPTSVIKSCWELSRLFRVYWSEKHASRAMEVKNFAELLNSVTRGSIRFSPKVLHFDTPPLCLAHQYFHFPDEKLVPHDQKLILAKWTMHDRVKGAL